MIKKILVAVDGSSYTEKTLTMACELASALVAELHLIYVSPVDQLFMSLGPAALLAQKTDFEEVANEVMSHVSLRAKHLGCPLAGSYHELGEPGRLIVEKANQIDADLIVLGSQGHSDLSGILIGSVSHRVTHLARCATLVVR